MLYNQLSSMLVCSFWVDEGKDMETLENVEQKSSKPSRQFALKSSGVTVFAEKSGKKNGKELRVI